MSRLSANQPGTLANPARGWKELGLDKNGIACTRDGYVPPGGDIRFAGAYDVGTSASWGGQLTFTAGGEFGSFAVTRIWARKIRDQVELRVSTTFTATTGTTHDTIVLTHLPFRTTAFGTAERIMAGVATAYDTTGFTSVSGSVSLLSNAGGAAQVDLKTATASRANTMLITCVYPADQ